MSVSSPEPPPPSPAWKAGYEKRWGNKKKCKFVYLRLDNFLPRIIIYIKNSFPDPDPAQNFDADADPDGGEGVGQPKMYIPPGKILGTALSVSSKIYRLFTIFTEVRRNHKNVNTYLLANRVSSIERSSPHCMARLHASLKSSNTSLKRCTEFEHLAGSTKKIRIRIRVISWIRNRIRINLQMTSKKL
jgi:hypothetical protein